jgi:hypothetical protein
MRARMLTSHLAHPFRVRGIEKNSSPPSLVRNLASQTASLDLGRNGSLSEAFRSLASPITFMTLYGGSRLLRCSCQSADGPATVSALRDLIPDQVAPERFYLEELWWFPKQDYTKSSPMQPWAAPLALMGACNSTYPRRPSLRGSFCAPSLTTTQCKPLTRGGRLWFRPRVRTG